ncbi:MAG: aldo/keto reductase, partial [Bacillota bacterium]
SEEIMGEVLKQLAWPRVRYVVSTKFFWGMNEGPNEKNTLNRKYLMQAIDGSLKRLQLDFVDLVYCHRPDPNTPIEETVWAMHDMIARGKALYWGTSEWSAADIRAAWQIADRHHLHKPIVEQPEYNLFHRERVEQEYAPLYNETGLGLTTWSPLASGLLTGKYRSGIPAGSRGSIPRMSFLVDRLTDKRANAAVAQLEKIAKDLGASVAQLAIAWCLKNPHVSSVITGASRVSQLEENLQAAEIAPKITTQQIERIEALVANA